MLRFLSAIMGLLPWPVVYVLSTLLSRLLALFYRRRLVQANMERALPALEVSERERIGSACYTNLADIALETLKGAKIGAGELLGRVEVVENAELARLREHGGPFLLFASHFSNWEWGALAVGLHVGPVDPIYKPLRNQSADQWMYQYRSKFGNRPVHLDQVGRVIRHMDEFRGLAIVADQAPSKGNKGKVWANFLGIPTAFYRGVFALPYLTQWPAYYASVQRTDRGHYRVVTTQIGAPPYEKGDLTILQRYIACSEKEINSDPANWLWTHKRWKYTRRDNEELLIFRK